MRAPVHVGREPSEGEAAAGGWVGGGAKVGAPSWARIRHRYTALGDVML